MLVYIPTILPSNQELRTFASIPAKPWHLDTNTIICKVFLRHSSNRVTLRFPRSTFFLLMLWYQLLDFHTKQICFGLSGKAHTYLFLSSFPKYLILIRVELDLYIRLLFFLSDLMWNISLSPTILLKIIWYNFKKPSNLWYSFNYVHLVLWLILFL